jgi:hypothetical protein
VVEIGQHQSGAVTEIAEAARLRLDHTRQDLQGITRTMVFGAE